jgi:outer membrane protein assembly factor BamB
MASFEIIVQSVPCVRRITASRTHQSAIQSLESERNETHRSIHLSLGEDTVQASRETDESSCVLRDILAGTAAVLEGRMAKAFVQLDGGPWELCVCAEPATLLVSVYKSGALPEVLWLNTPVSKDQLRAQCEVALHTLTPQLSPAVAAELTALYNKLATACRAPEPVTCSAEAETLQWQSSASGPVQIGFTAQIQAEPGDSCVRGPHADLHALLFGGALAFQVRGLRAQLPAGFLFLQLERLVALSRPMIDSFAARKPMHARTNAGRAQIALRLSQEGQLSFTLTGTNGAAVTAANLDPRELAIPLANAALHLCRSLVQSDRIRAKNLRLRALRSDARALRRVATDLGRGEDKLNTETSLYRASALVDEAEPSTPAAARDRGNQRLRYLERWRAEVEGIDLAGVALTDDAVIVPGARELASLDRRTGALLWSHALPRAATTVIGDGILRLNPRGDAELRDTRDGELRWSSKIAPRIGGTPHALAVCSRGLPRVVVIAEGERRLVALDLHTGEARWRFTTRNGNNFRFRRVGRLLVTASGDSSLSALDIGTGEVVWRVVAETPFATAATHKQESIYAVGGAPGRGRAQLFSIDAFSGKTQWIHAFDGPAVSIAATTGSSVVVVIMSPEGPKLVGLHAADGTAKFSVPLGNSPLRGRSASITTFHGLYIVNLPSGRVCAVDSETGTTRWSRVLGTPRETDIPRRLEPHARSGVIFVPQTTLGALRPSDGASIADLAVCELVPDWLRVDDDCSLFVGEESGHLRCFEAAARLAMVMN